MDSGRAAWLRAASGSPRRRIPPPSGCTWRFNGVSDQRGRIPERRPAPWQNPWENGLLTYDYSRRTMPCGCPSPGSQGHTAGKSPCPASGILPDIPFAVPQVDTFPSGEAFWFRYEKDRSFDILLLDIEMGGRNGVEVARQIRQDNQRNRLSLSRDSRISWQKGMRSRPCTI